MDSKEHIPKSKKLYTLINRRLIMIIQLVIVKNIDYQKYHNNTETLKRVFNAHRTQKINVKCMTFNSLTFEHVQLQRLFNPIQFIIKFR